MSGPEYIKRIHRSNRYEVEAEICNGQFRVTGCYFKGSLYECFILSAQEYEEVVVPRLYEQANRWADRVLENHNKGIL